MNELILQAKKALAKAEESFEIAKSKLNELEQSAENLNAEYRELLSWADMFDKCSFDSKKMIVSQLIKSVRVGKDYAIEIDFNVTFEEYQRYFLQKSA